MVAERKVPRITHWRSLHYASEYTPTDEKRRIASEYPVTQLPESGFPTTQLRLRGKVAYRLQHAAQHGAHVQNFVNEMCDFALGPSTMGIDAPDF